MSKEEKTLRDLHDAGTKGYYIGGIIFLIGGAIHLVSAILMFL